MKQKEYIDITMDLNIAFETFNPETIAHFSPKLLGHVGTHIDIMDTPGLSIERFISKAHLIDVSDIFEREITMQDARLDHINIEPQDSVIFKTNWSNEMIGTSKYFINHPYLSYELVDFMVKKQVNLIAIDAPGVRRGQEHRLIDIHCASHGVFIVENIVNLSLINISQELVLYCFPLKFTKNTGVTCRVVVGY